MSGVGAVLGVLLMTSLCSQNVLCSVGSGVSLPSQSYMSFDEICKQLAERFLGIPVSSCKDLKALACLMSGSMIERLEISDTCKVALGEMCSEGTPEWLTRMLDATAKIPPGLLMFRAYTFGAYDECIDIEVNNCSRTKKCEEQPMLGQYCSVGIEKTYLGNKSTTYGGGLGLPGTGSLLYSMGICVPSYCSRSDLLQLLGGITVPAESLGMIGQLLVRGKPNNIGLRLNVSRCQTREKEELTSPQIGIIVVFAHLGFFLLIGTLTDIGLILAGYKTSDGKLDVHSGMWKVIFQLLLSFSIITNGQKLLNTKTGKDDLSAVHGIRFLSMSWVILGHSYTFLNFIALANLMTIGEYTKRFLFQVVLNGTLSVDSFLFLSGLLVGFYFLKEYKKARGRYNWFLHYFHRIWRLTPAYALVIALAILWPQFGKGPIWQENIEVLQKPCSNSWWTSILYINNFVGDDMCLGHGWYLSNDMQFYIIAPIILLLIYSFPRFGHFFNLLVIIAASVASGVIINKYKFAPTTVINKQAFMNNAENAKHTFFKDIYIKPYCRIGPYCIGLAVGHVLAFHRNFKLDKGYQVIAWLVATGFALVGVFGVFDWNQPDKEPPSTAVSALYGSTFRVLFSLGLAWMTLACLTGRGGFINSILSWKLFVPLGRLTYMAYLLHPLIMYTTNGLTKETVMFSHYQTVIMFFAHLLFSYLAALLGSLAFEAPFISLEKIMFGRRPKEVTTTDDVDAKEISLHGSFHSSDLNRKLPLPDYDPDEKLAPMGLAYYQRRTSAYPDEDAPPPRSLDQYQRRASAYTTQDVPPHQRRASAYPEEPRSPDRYKRRAQGIGVAPRDFDYYLRRKSAVPLQDQRRMSGVPLGRYNPEIRRFSAVPYAGGNDNNGYTPDSSEELRRF